MIVRSDPVSLSITAGGADGLPRSSSFTAPLDETPTRSIPSRPIQLGLGRNIAASPSGTDPASPAPPRHKLKQTVGLGFASYTRPVSAFPLCSSTRY